MSVCVLSLHLCPAVCNHMDLNLPGFSILGFLQARMLEWVAMPSSRGSSRPRDGTGISCIAGGFFILAPRVKPLL